MEWRIRQSSRGWYAEYGAQVESVEAGFKIGYLMPCFHVSESARFDTETEAKKYIAEKEHDNENQVF